MTGVSDMIGLFFLLWVIIAIVRWLVWRMRLKDIRSALGGLTKDIQEVRKNISLLQETLRAGRPPVELAAPRPAEVRKETPIAPGPKEAAEEESLPAETAIEEVLIGRRPLPVAEMSPVPAEPRTAEPVLFAPSRLGARLKDAIKSAGGEGEWEMLIGGRWLNKIGVAVLVIGMALLLNFSLQYMGPPGKVVLGLAVSLVLILGGVWLEWRHGYAIIAKSLMGGGWALLYFTAYAAHNIDAARIIDNPVLGLTVLIAVAAGMIAHSLKYKSQAVTSLAFFLGFLAIDISPLTVYSLIAVAILAGSLILILRRRSWHELGLFGVVATYLTHFIWSAWTPPPAGSTPIQAFWLSQGTLIVYWLLFASCDIRAPASDKRGQIVGLALNVANTLGFFALSIIQIMALFPHELYVLGGAGAVAYAAKSAIDRRWGSRALHLIDGSIAIGLLAAASALAARPLWIPAEWLAVALLVQAMLAVAVGFWLKEQVFRGAGYVLLESALFFALAFNVFALYVLIDVGDLLAVNQQQVFEILHTLYMVPVGLRILRWATVLPVIGVLFLLEFFQRRLGLRPDVTDEKTVGLAAGYGAAILWGALLWQETPQAYLGLAWLGSAVLLCEWGLRRRHLHRRLQGYLFFGFAACGLLAINLYGVVGSLEGGAPSRWITVTPAVAAGWYLFWRLWHQGAAGEISEIEGRQQAWLAHVGTGLLAVLVWKQLDPSAVAVAWGAIALATSEVGSRSRIRAISLQSDVLTALAFVHLFLADFIATGIAFGISIRLWTVVPVIGLLYYRAFPPSHSEASRGFRPLEDRVASFYLYAAAFALAVLARFEFDRAHAVIVWAGLSLVYLALGVKLANRDFRWQAYLMAIAAFVRSWGTNFYLTGNYYGVPERVATTVPVIICLFAGGLLWRARRASLATTPEGAGVVLYLTLLDLRSKAIMLSLAAILLASLLFYTVTGNLLTIAWAAEGLLLLGAGFSISERTLRLLGLGLLAICLFKVFIVDLSGVETIYRIMSFIVLGIILLAVSFAYTRYREVVRRYL